MNETTKELLERAYALRDQGDARGALALLQGAGEGWPPRALLQLHSLIGHCHDDRNQLAEAEQAYRRSVAIERRPETLSFLAYALSRQDREAESLACLREVIELDPQYEEAHYNIGRLLRQKGDLDAAVDCFQKAIDIDPQYALAHADLGSALIPIDQQRALRHLRRSIELDPEDYWSRLYLGNLLWTLKRLRQARIQYEAAARLKPDDGFVLAASADFLSVQSGGSARVEPRFRRAIELAPEEPFVRLCYGQHLLRARRYGEARRELLLADRLGHTRAHLVLVDLGEE